jgi:hypothetical protein
MKARAALMALGAVLVTATPAHAAKRPAPYVDWMPKFTQAAVDYWGQPQCGTPTFLWVTNLPPSRAAEVAPGCVVNVNVFVWHRMSEPRERCVLVFHEVGHLDGHQHEEGGVMAAEPWVATGFGDYFGPCARIAPEAR